MTNYLEFLTIVNNDGTGVGMGLALLISLGLRRVISLEWKVLHAVELWGRLLGSLLGGIGCNASW